MRSVSVRKKHDAVGREEEGRPEKSRANGKQVIQVPRLRVIGRGKLPVGKRSSLREKRICPEPVLFETKTVLNQRRAGVGVVPDAIAVNDRIDQRKRTEKYKEEDSPILGRSTFVGGGTHGSTRG